LKARLLLLAAGVLFSTGGAAVKGTVLNAWQVAGLRSLIAAAVILAVLPEARRHWRWRYVPVAASYAATLILFVTANKLTTAANAIFLQGSAPFFVLLLSPVLLRERIRRSDFGVMAVVACGMSLFFLSHERTFATAPDPARGNLLGAASGLTWAITLMGLRWIGRSEGTNSGAGLATVSLGNLLTSAATLPLAFPIAQAGPRDVAIIVWLGAFQVALAYICLTKGIRSVSAMEAVVLLLSEPALNPVWAWLVHGETPAGLSIVGGALIFVAILAKSWWQGRRPG
jgi:DME family drug/metabolite transporter